MGKRGGAWREELALRVLEELATARERADVIERILSLAREHTGLAVAAIRLREGEDFPYHLAQGLSADHLQLERSVLAVDPCPPPLVCLCGRVLRGETDPALGCFSAGGSFFTASLQEQQRTLPGIRGGCVREGLETHALIPLRDGDEMIGLLQLSDPRAGVLEPDDVRFLERLGASVGIALSRRRSEELRRQTEETYRGFFEKLRWGYAQHRLLRDERGEPEDYVTLEVNRTFEELLRTPRAAVIGTRASAILPPAELARWLAIFAPVAAGGAPASYELYSPLNDRSFRGHAFSPEPDTFSVAFEDVTEALRAEQAVRESEERFQKAFRSAPMLMTLSRVADGRYLEVNDRFCAVTGFSREEAVGKTSVELGWIAPADRVRLIEELLRQRGVRDLELELRAKDGRRVVCRYSGELVRAGGEELLLSIATDISEEQRARAALHESEARFRELADLLPLSLFETDREGRLTYANQVACSTFGYTSAELTAGLNVAAMIDPADRERAARAFGAALNGTATTGNTYLGLRRSGESFPIRIYSCRIVRGGELRGLRGAIVDETATRRGEEERERLQAQLVHAQKMESIGTLAGGIAHDFNNLLGGILGSLSLMEEELGESFPYHEDLVEMKSLVGRGADLTRQLLGFARRGTLDPRPLDLNLIVEKTARLYGRTRKDVVLRLEREPQLPTVLADRTQVEQVLLNLFLNAGQAMPEGGVLWVRTESVELALEAAAARGAEPGRYVRLDVVDSGIGMSETTLARIFEPFFTTREGHGTGLGLASVQGIVTAHGGFVTVESKPGEGSTFSVYLPASDERPLEETDRGGIARRGGETVLVIDDEEPVLRVTRRLLERLGHEVLTARSGLEALDHLRRERGRVSLVILDMIMPGMSGRQTYDALREVAPALKVLIASGHSEEGQAADLLARGCLGFIQKPFDVARLAAKLAEIL